MNWLRCGGKWFEEITFVNCDHADGSADWMIKFVCETPHGVQRVELIPRIFILEMKIRKNSRKCNLRLENSRYFPICMSMAQTTSFAFLFSSSWFEWCQSVAFSTLQVIKNECSQVGKETNIIYAQKWRVPESLTLNQHSELLFIGVTVLNYANHD